MRLDGKVAIVTGGSAGIGGAVTRAFAAAGCKVVIADFDDAASTAMVEELGETVLFSHCDVRDAGDIQAAVDMAVTRFGGLDIVVNNAGAGHGGGLEGTTIEDWHRVMDTNLTAAFLMMKAALPHLKARPGASVLNTSSVSGIRGDYGLFVYNTTKAGLANMTRSLALDLAKDGIRVNAVCPGLIETKMTSALKTFPGGLELWTNRIPMRRQGTPDEAAAAFLFLASDLASYVTGSLLVVDGGLTAQSGFPSPDDFMAAAGAGA